MSRDRSKSRKMKKMIMLCVIALIIVLAGILVTRMIWDKNKADERNKEAATTQNTEAEPIAEPEPEKKEPEIFNGTDRPIAVMIDNHTGAWPQAGLNKTYLVYEIIVEGGETRLMALFKGQDVKTVGPVRSSRHYFLDYAMENDALYAHYGWSPQAQKDISTYSINNINGIFYNKPTFWRITAKRAPHNAMTSTEQILKASKAKGYRTKSEASSLLTYAQEEVNLEEGKTAKEVKIRHSYLQNVTYKYNTKTQRYTRYARGILQKDYNTGEAVTTKNIIVMFAKNSVLQDGTTKDRQNLHNIGTFNGYYITNGKAIKIKCEKKDRRSRTIYREASTGKELEINDGNTWINICPAKDNLTLK